MVKKKPISQSAFFVGLIFCFAGVLIALFASGAATGPFQSPVANKLERDIARIMDPVSQDLDLVSLGQFEKTGNLNTGRTDHTATLLPNGLVLAVGGEDPNFNVIASAELYDPITASWTNTGSLNTGRRNHTATLLPDGLVLVAGGQDSSSVSSSAEVYDPTSGTWTITGSLKTARSNHTATLLPNGIVLVTGGVDSNFNALASTELFDPAT